MSSGRERLSGTKLIEHDPCFVFCACGCYTCGTRDRVLVLGQPSVCMHRVCYLLSHLAKSDGPVRRSSNRGYRAEADSSAHGPVSASRPGFSLILASLYLWASFFGIAVLGELFGILRSLRSFWKSQTFSTSPGASLGTACIRCRSQPSGYLAAKQRKSRACFTSTCSGIDLWCQICSG